MPVIADETQRASVEARCHPPRPAAADTPAGEHGDGAYMIVPGEMRRAVYEPLPGGDQDVWHYGGLIG